MILFRIFLYFLVGGISALLLTIGAELADIDMDIHWVSISIGLCSLFWPIAAPVAGGIILAKLWVKHHK